MNILAIDTITPVLSVAASGPAGKAFFSLSDSVQHAESLLAAIEKVLDGAGFTARQTNLVICAEGPGSFTGLRLAYATAKAIQLAADCPLFPVPPLPCYAEPFHAWPGVVISVLDAKKKRFYAQVFRRGSAVTGAMDIGEIEIMQQVDPAERILITGPDAVLFAENLALAVPGLDLAVLPSGTRGIADVLIQFAEIRFPDYTGSIPDHSGPVYVRKSDAETDNSKRHERI